MRRATFLATTSSVAMLAYGMPSRGLAAPRVILGDDVFIAETWRELNGRGVGIVTNRTGALGNGTHIVDAARANPALNLKALFAPEHGLRGDRPAGADVGSYVDERTGLPVYSLYGATRHPTAKMLEGIEVLLVDLQDVGARPYTYVSTMAYVMQTAREHDIEVWVLDRPNPIGGLRVEGPVLEPHFSSFIGLYPIPERHGMTIGELARLFNDAFAINARLRVVAMRGWTREMFWNETGLRWIPTSPNIPYARTTMVYLATGLVDQGGVNNGIGTDRPFEYAGGYGFDAQAFATTLATREIPGVHFEPVTWSPHSGFWAGKALRGVRIDVTDPAIFPNVRTAVEVLAAAREQHKFIVANAASMDRDWGTDRVRRGLLSGASVDSIVAAWEPGLVAFAPLRERALLYAKG